MKRVLPPLALVPLVCVACGGASSDSAEVATSSSDLDTTFPGAIASDPFTMAFAQSWDDGPGSATDDTKCHGCSTSPDVDPASQVVTTVVPGALGDYKIAAWAPGGGGLPSTYGAAAGIGDSLLSGSSAFNNVDDELNDIASDLNKICDAINVTCTVKKDPTVPKRWMRAFPKVQGRQLFGEFTRDPDGFDSLKTYPSPRVFGEQRSRGAKTYCAMRQTVAQQEASTTDASTLENPDPVGTFAYWSFGNTAAKVKVMAPQKFTSDSESEAFLVPIAFSGAPNPISGPAMPHIDELSHRMMWVTGDREIFSTEDFGTTIQKVCIPTRVGPVCRPHFVNTFRKAYRNLEHVDVFSGEQVQGHVGVGGIPVLLFPPLFNVTMGGDIFVDSGLVDDDSALAAGRVRFPAFDGLAPRATTFDDALSTPSLTADAPLLTNGSTFLVEGGKSSIRIAPIGFAPLVRWRNDDDRAVTIYDRVKEDVHLDATLGIDLGPVHVSLDAHSNLNLTQTQRITLREQLSLVDGHNATPASHGPAPMPQTNIVVVPSSDFDATWDPFSLDLNMTLDFDIDLGIAGTVHIHLGWDVPLYTAPPVTLAHPTVDATDEGQRLRVGEYSDLGATSFDGVNDAPSVYSHLPNRTLPYASFPPPGSAFAGNTVKACLADPTSPPDPTPPGPHVSPPPPAVGAICAIGPGLAEANAPPLPTDLCTSATSVDTYATGVANAWPGNTTDPTRIATQIDLETACIRDVVAFLCGGVSRELPGPVYSRVMASIPDMQQWGALTLQCTSAFAMGAPDGPTATALADTVRATLFPSTGCSPDGTP